MRSLIVLVGLGLVGAAIFVLVSPDSAEPANPDTPSAAASAPSSERPAPVPTPTRTATPRPSPSPTRRPTPATVDEVYAGFGLDVPDGPVPQAGCPPPPPEPGGSEGVPRWTPPHTVPDAQLPAPAAVEMWESDIGPFAGKGMWVWKYSRAEGGALQEVVDRAAGAGLEQIWVRVGDSRYGFYAADYLEELVPAAHDVGIAVIGWGFPFLHDPAHDIAWSMDAMAWRGPHGRGLDGFSPDIEMETEKVKLSARRVEVYLSHVRQAAGDLPVAATVYPPADWVVDSGYPYETMAPYVDAFVPMAYWMCAEPGALAARSVERLADLRPVHVIGQAFHNHSHGRRVNPSGDETLRFLDSAARTGAIGASFWVWDFIDEQQWAALAAYPWRETVAARQP